MFYNGYVYLGYVNSALSYLTKCSINMQGVLSSCGSTGSNFQTPFHITNYNNYLYAVNSDPSTITYCKISTTDGSLSGCAFTGTGGAAISVPRGIEYYNGNMYVANASGNKILACPVNTTNGSLGACTIAKSGTNGSPTVMFYNNIAYYSSWSYTTLANFCPMNAGIPFGTPCGGPTGDNFNQYVYSLANYGGYVYASGSNGSLNVTSCSISLIDGTFSGCTSNTGGGNIKNTMQITFYDPLWNQ